MTCVFVGQWPDEHRVDDAENERCARDADGKRDDGCGREARDATEGPGGQPEIAEEASKPEVRRLAPNGSPPGLDSAWRHTGRGCVTSPRGGRCVLSGDRSGGRFTVFDPACFERSHRVVLRGWLPVGNRTECQ